MTFTEKRVLTFRIICWR